MVKALYLVVKSQSDPSILTPKIMYQSVFLILLVLMFVSVKSQMFFVKSLKSPVSFSSSSPLTFRIHRGNQVRLQLWLGKGQLHRLWCRRSLGDRGGGGVEPMAEPWREEPLGGSGLGQWNHGSITQHWSWNHYQIVFFTRFNQGQLTLDSGESEQNGCGS
jgi:hypothetical protein